MMSRKKLIVKNRNYKRILPCESDELNNPIQLIKRAKDRIVGNSNRHSALALLLGLIDFFFILTFLILSMTID
ncbi:hypothetical protein BpHYR1_039907 [Brachionus plicatilis]|uniref:Uncharacterized protein n=1 Tax=Brachionus plicatilis TaxID=10195 RepID=A0A3M7R2L7_BRAPC|nr:hypothetical protein BpHYR1_039907 [Brachionus plicatilis]